jgi:hypothetical protein
MYKTRIRLYFCEDYNGNIATTRNILILVTVIERENLLYSLFGGPPLWSSGQSSWLQNRRLGFDSRHYQKKKYWVWNGVHSDS